MRTTPPQRVLSWAVRIGLLALVILAPWPFGSVTPRPAALLASALVVLAGVFVISNVHRRSLPSVPGWVWLVPACGLIALQQVPVPPGWLNVFAPAVGSFVEPPHVMKGTSIWHPVSAEPFQTWWRLLQLLSFLAAFFLASQFFRRGRDRTMFAYTLTVLGVALALYGVYQSARFGNVIYGRYQVPSGTSYGPFVNHNHFAGFVEACALVSLGTALGRTRRSSALSLLLGGASGLMGISLVLSHSRGGLIATGAGLTILLLLLSRPRDTSGRRWILVGVAAVTLFLVAFAPSSLSDRLSTLGDPSEDSSIRFRVALWSDSLALVADSPIVGTGFGTYAAVIPSYRTGNDETRADFAESDWLQLVCETGLIGTFLAVGFLATIFRLGRHALEGETSRRARGTLLGAHAATSALLVHGLYDFNLHIPSNALLFAVLLGLLASSEPCRPLTWTSNRVFPVVTAGVLVGVVSFSFSAIRIGESRRLTREIDPVLTGADQFTETIQRLVRSRESVPRNPETVYLLGRLYNEEAYRSSDASTYREVRLDQAAEAFRDAVSLAPARGRYWFELAWTEANRGNDDLADVLFARAFELEPHHSGMRANHALYLAARGRIDEALEQLEHSRELDPGIPPLEVLNIIGPYIQGDSALMERAAGPGADAQAALEKFRHNTETEPTEQR